jgi:acyl carrier protein
MYEDRSPDELKRFLETKLPRHMVPAVIVMLDRIPQTASGKPDRQALPALESAPGSARRLPSTELEKTLAIIWQDILGIDSVGISDDFHRLGGDSLLIVRILVRIEWDLKVVLSVTEFLQAPTVHQLARLIDKRQTPSARVPKLFCLSFSQVLAKHLPADVSVYSIEVVEEDTYQHPTIDRLAAALVKRVRAIQPEGPYYLFGFCFEAVLALAVAQELHRQGQPIGLLTLADLPTFLTMNGSMPYRLFRKMSHRLTRVKVHLGWFLRNGVRHWPSYLAARLGGVKDRVAQSILPMPEYTDFGPLGKGNPELRYSIQRYVPGRFDASIKLIFGNDWAAQNIEEMTKTWRRTGLTSLDCVRLPVDHEMWEEPSVGVLARCLADCIRKGHANSATKE